jgi:type III pantothenate kinase
VSLLLVDVGNTRVKWATCEHGVLAPQQAAEHAGWGVAEWADRLFGGHRVTAVWAASVAGDDSKRALGEAAARCGVTDVRFVASTSQACGVRNAYPDPRLLGVDRWAAVIGAYHLHAPRACCVVDVGTAATIDAVVADGVHLGGFIVPGPHLMARSLLAGTSDLEAHTQASRAGRRSLYADNTRDAIERGCRVALAALIDRAHADLAGSSADVPALVVTGGAAAEVLPYVLSAVEHVPDLVLHGIARMAAAKALNPAV